MLIFAHRGASGVEPENTLRAIKAALDADVDGIFSNFPTMAKSHVAHLMFNSKNEL